MQRDVCTSTDIRLKAGVIKKVLLSQMQMDKSSQISQLNNCKSKTQRKI